jgi:uncharacterized HAD superfamily protein
MERDAEHYDKKQLIEAQPGNYFNFYETYEYTVYKNIQKYSKAVVNV